MIETIEKIAEQRKRLDAERPNDYRFLPGWEMAKREAAIEIEKLSKTLADEVANIAVPVYVEGAQAAALAKSMQDQTPAAIVDLEALYGPLADRVKQSMGRGNEFGVNQFALIVREVRQLGIDNGVASMKLPKFNAPVVCPDTQALKKTMLEYVNDMVDTELTVNYIRKQAREQVAAEITSKVPVFPVFVVNYAGDKESLTKKLFKRNLDAVVEAPAEVNEETTLSALKSIKKSLKEKKD
jgi:tagatose-1,6-bisphosphate aldolase